MSEGREEGKETEETGMDGGGGEEEGTGEGRGGWVGGKHTRPRLKSMVAFVC